MPILNMRDRRTVYQGCHKYTISNGWSYLSEDIETKCGMMKYREKPHYLSKDIETKCGMMNYRVKPHYLSKDIETKCGMMKYRDKP